MKIVESAFAGVLCSSQYLGIIFGHGRVNYRPATLRLLMQLEQIPKMRKL